jgi:hypothetical protein
MTATLSALAQTPEELRRELDELKAAVRQQAEQVKVQAKAIERLESENAALKGPAPSVAGLEHEVNRLSERLAAGTNLRSCASQVKLGGEFRYRVAYASGNNLVPVGTEGTVGGIPVDPAEHDGYWGDARVRLNFQYDFGCDVTAFAELQQHWGFGQDDDGLPGEFDADLEGGVHMYQAWLEFRNVFCRPELTARIGRQEVVLGNQFQFGNADWYNGIVHDALRVDWRSSCWSLTLLAMKLTTMDGDFNQFPSFPAPHDDDELYSAYFTLKSIKNHVLDLYWIYVNGHDGDSEDSGAAILGDSLFPGTAYYHTFGARIGGWWNVACGLDWNLEGAIQTGESNPMGLDVSGASAEAEIGLTLSKASRFRIFARALYAEGADDDSTGYLIAFPNRHSNTGFRARYGLADVIPMQNIITAQLGFHFDPACNWTIGATALWARIDGTFATPEPLDDDFGTELDFWAEYRYSRQITFGAGLAFVFPEDLGQLFIFSTDDTKVLAYLQARLIF